MLPGEVLEEDAPTPKKAAKKPRKGTLRSRLIQEQVNLGVTPDGIEGPQTQAARTASIERAYAENRVVIVRNQTRSDVLLPGNLGILRSLGTMDILLPSVDTLRGDPRWAALAARAIIQVYVAERPPLSKSTKGSDIPKVINWRDDF